MLLGTICRLTWLGPSNHGRITRKHVYQILKANTIDLEFRRESKPVRPVSKDVLEKLYNEERLTVPRIESRLNITPREVARKLDRHRIWTETRVSTRFDSLQLAKLQL